MESIVITLCISECWLLFQYLLTSEIRSFLQTPSFDRTQEQENEVRHYNPSYIFPNNNNLMYEPWTSIFPLNVWIHGLFIWNLSIKKYQSMILFMLWQDGHPFPTLPSIPRNYSFRSWCLWRGPCQHSTVLLSRHKRKSSSVCIMTSK